MVISGTKKLVPMLRSIKRRIPADSSTPNASKPRIAVTNRAHKRSDAENRDADDPQVRAEALTWSRRLDRAQRRITRPTVERRSSGNEESRDHYDKSKEGGPERKHVENRESHVRRPDLNGQEIISEATLRRGRQHKEHHDGAVHRHQGEIRLRLDVTQERQSSRRPD